MNKFCIYKGVKVIKPETWDITSVELSSDYTSVIIQAESKSNKSEYTLDITPLISNQYENGIDPYSATIINELTGVSDWVLDPVKNSIEYVQNDSDPKSPQYQYYWQQGDFIARTADELHQMRFNAYKGDNYLDWESIGSCYIDGRAQCSRNLVGYGTDTVEYSPTQNPAYDPDYTREKKTLPLETVAQKVISNAAGDPAAQEVITSVFNNRVDIILSSDYSEFFEQNKQPK